MTHPATACLQTSFEDKDSGQVMSAVDCYFQCQVKVKLNGVAAAVATAVVTGLAG